MTFDKIAVIRTDFPDKFGIPRQSGILDSLESRIIFEKKYRNPDALRGLEGFSHIWLLWEFSESIREKWQPMVRPPRLGGNTPMGVFATRSPFRPNPIGLSCVRLLRMEHTEKEGDVLIVSGADMVDRTPIYDIKPYLPYADCHPDATGGFAEPLREQKLEVSDPDNLLSCIAEEKREAVVTILENDPRPHYQHDETRLYGFYFDGFDIRFTVSGNQLTLRETERIDKNGQSQQGKLLS